MEYQIQIKNVFNRQAVLDMLRSGRLPTSPYQPYPYTALYFSSIYNSSNTLYNFLNGRSPVLQTADFDMYLLSSKGGKEKDYYLLDSRCLIYDRQIKWAYWENQLNSLDVTAEQIQGICPPVSMTNIRKHLSHLNTTMRKYEINTRLRQAHFLSQLAHESGHFHKTLEGASGEAYEGRTKYLGNTKPGDGPRFKGRGLIQLTGRAVYAAYGKYIGRDITTGDNMQLIEQEPYASDCAGWFWLFYKGYAKLNTKADRDDVLAVTLGVNGGTKGFPERKLFLRNAKNVFSL